MPPPSRNAKIAGYAAAFSAVVGFIPLHFVWALGIPFLADESKFDAWYADGGGAYLVGLNVLALLPAVLALALVRPWGLVFPRWVPFLAGRRVPRRLLVIPGYAVAAFLLLYQLYAVVLATIQFDDPAAIFSPWTGVYGVVQFLIWWLGLYIATSSYAARTSKVLEDAHRGSQYQSAGQSDVRSG